MPPPQDAPSLRAGLEHRDARSCRLLRKTTYRRPRHAAARVASRHRHAGAVALLRRARAALHGAAALAPRLRRLGAARLDARCAGRRGDLPGAARRGGTCRRLAGGESLDQALVSYIDYVRAGFEDQGAFDRLFSSDPPTPQLEQWDLNREMTFRIAWKPYMYNPTPPPLLAGVQTPALVVHGSRDRIVPPGCAEQYARALPKSRLAVVDSAGHFLEMEQPDTLAKLITQFVAES